MLVLAPGGGAREGGRGNRAQEIQFSAPRPRAENTAFAHAASKALKTHGFQTLFTCAYEVALKWMGRDGLLQEIFHPWGGHPLAGTRVTSGPFPTIY